MMLSAATDFNKACGAGRVRINGVCVARTPSARFAGARDGVEALAFGGTDTHAGSHTTFKPPDLNPRAGLAGVGDPDGDLLDDAVIVGLDHMQRAVNKSRQAFRRLSGSYACFVGGGVQRHTESFYNSCQPCECL